VSRAPHSSKIPFNKPFIIGKEMHHISEAVSRYIHLAGDGWFTRKCQAWLEKHLTCRKVLLTHSCTAALDMSAILANIGPGDEVIMPSYGFVSTANAFVLRGAKPVFVDIRPDTLNIDENEIAKAVNKKTKAIVPIHYAGVGCDMHCIMQIARSHNLSVIEDAAQALLSKDGDRCLGTIGDLGTISFHETKNIISGEGGALLVNNEEMLERAEIIWHKGTDRARFLRGEVGKYTWLDLGSSFLPGELMAAFLYSQLQHVQTINARRRAIVKSYYKLLKPLENDKKLRLPGWKNFSQTNGHLFYIITKSREERSRLIEFLDAQGIQAVFHFIPLHSSPAGRRFGKAFGKLPVTEDISEKILRLPLYFEMTDNELRTVVTAIQNFYDD